MHVVTFHFDAEENVLFYARRQKNGSLLKMSKPFYCKTDTTWYTRKI